MNPKSEDEIRYALSKQVPDLTDRVSLSTNYGKLVLEGGEAEKVAALVKKLLRTRLSKLEKAKATPSAGQ